jgi:BRCA1-associated protein
VGEGSGSAVSGNKDEWGGERAEGEDGSLIAILAVPAWMRPADFLEFIGGWSTCLEGVRMIR